MEQDSFSITLQSNLDTDKFSNNTNFRFRNSVPAGLDLHNYQVGLQSIYFTDNYDRTPPKPVVLHQKSTKPFFNTDLEEDLVVVQTTIPKHLNGIKNENRLDQFLIKFNVELAKYNYKIQISPTLQSGQIIGVKITNTSDNIYHTSLDESLGKVLGFSKLQVPHGESSSNVAIKLSDFTSLELKSVVGTISQYRINQEEIKLSQFEGEPVLSDLCNEIVLALEKKDHKISLTAVIGHDAINFDLDSPTRRLILSDYLLDYLGLPDSFTFIGSGTVVVKKGLSQDPNEIDDFAFQHSKQSSSKLFVTCDLIEENYFAGKPLNYLAVIDRSTTQNMESSYHPRKILFKQVVPRNPRQIEISIYSDKLEFIPLSDSPSVVCLNFIKSRLL